MYKIFLMFVSPQEEAANVLDLQRLHAGKGLPSVCVKQLTNKQTKTKQKQQQ